MRFMTCLINLFELIYWHKHLWDYSRELIQTTNVMFISCFQLISISSAGQLIKQLIYVPMAMSITQLVGTPHYICKAGFEPGIPHIFTSKGEFLATRLLDQNK
jgi:hypothetical protein